MYPLSDAYRLVSHLYDTFLGVNDVLQPGELVKNSITITEAIDQKVFPRIEIQSQIDDRPVVQTLKKSKRGDFRLSTTFSDNEGGHVQHNVRPEAETKLLDMEPMYVVGHCLFMAKLVHIALTR